MMLFLWLCVEWLMGLIALPLAFWVYRNYHYTRQGWFDWKWWRLRARVDTLYIYHLPGRAIRLTQVSWRLDRLADWRWRLPLGRGPRWLRRGWCFALHWPHFTQISDSTCGRVGRMQEHIVIRGCYTCQLPWWHTKTMVEDDDGRDKRNPVDRGDVEPPGGVQSGLGGLPPLLRGANSVSLGGDGEQELRGGREGNQAGVERNDRLRS